MQASQPKVLILGGGFAGLTCALELQHQARDLPDFLQPQISLVNQSPYHTYHPALYEAASYLPPEIPPQKVREALCIPLPNILYPRRINFLPKTVSDLDLKNKQVSFQDGSRLKFDWLVIALGSMTNFYNIPGLEQWSYTLKSFEDALEIRQAIAQTLQKLRSNETLKIVIGGAGPTGVELAGELHFFLTKLKKILGKPTTEVQIVIIEGAPQILPQFSARARQSAEKRLKKLGVNIITNSFITFVEKGRLFVKKNDKHQKQENIEYNVLIWTGGVKPNILLEKLPIKKDPRTHRAVVNSYLQALDDNEHVLKDVFVIGDLACYYEPKTGQPLPATAWLAEEQGKLTGENLMRSIAKLPLLPFKPPPSIYLIPVGSRYAILQTKYFTFRGFLPWILKQLIELKYFSGLMGFGRALIKWLRAEKLFLGND